MIVHLKSAISVEVRRFPTDVDDICIQKTKAIEGEVVKQYDCGDILLKADKCQREWGNGTSDWVLLSDFRLFNIRAQNIQATEEAE